MSSSAGNGARTARRAVLAAAFGLVALTTVIVFCYELALARVPQHRAALERLVRNQTGLDIRFDELGLRWGWYGPEAVFRGVSLGEAGELLLRAPELVVGFDAWRTLRSGHPQAGRIELVTPDIDLRVARHAPGAGATAPGSPAPGSADARPTADRMAVLRRWRGGRIDIEGGTLRITDPGAVSSVLALRIRSASLRRSDDEWSAFGLVFLPDRLGRTVRVTLRIDGDPHDLHGITGSLQLAGQRLLFAGCRDVLAATPLAGYLPRAGRGDVTLNLDFNQGHVTRAAGTVHAANLVFADRQHADVWTVDRVQSDFSATPSGEGWRVRLDPLTLAASDRPATLVLDAGVGNKGTWARGSLLRAPLKPVLAAARWWSPQLDLAGIDLSGTARVVTFDWDPARVLGDRFRTAARLEDVTLVPRFHDFSLRGLGVRVAGNERSLAVDVESRTAQLELAQSRQDPLSDVHVSSALRIDTNAGGWSVTTDEFVVSHRGAALNLSGRLHGNGADAQIVASGTLTGADIPLVERLLGASTQQAFGAAASHLTAGRIQDAQFELRGPVGELPFGAREGFTGSLTLRDAVVSGGELWPDARGIDARVDWRGSRIRAAVTAGTAGPFTVHAAHAAWDAAAETPTRLTGRIDGRLEDALKWIREHPQLAQYSPGAGELDASGDATFDIDVAVEPGSQRAVAKVAASLSAAKLVPVAGLPAMQVSGALEFNSGRLQHSILTGTWLGGPVNLRLGQRREAGRPVLAVAARGTMNVQALAAAANVGDHARGKADWNGELIFTPPAGPVAAHWRMRADASLLGVLSSLPEPFAKRSPAALPAHVDISGADAGALLHVALGDRLRSSFALQRVADGWTVARGAVRFGAATAALPVDPLVLVQGRLARFDLGAAMFALQRLRQDTVPAVVVRVTGNEMSVAGGHYDEVTVHGGRTPAGTELTVESEALHGLIRLPAAADAVGEVRFDRLRLPDTTVESEAAGLLAASIPKALVFVADLNWRGRSLGRFTASIGGRDGFAVQDAHLLSAVHDVSGSMQCTVTACRLGFSIDSHDVAATLQDFGFRADVSAPEGHLNGELQWPLASGRWLANLEGTVRLRVIDGAMPGPASHEDPAFALLAVPALVVGLDETAGRAPHDLQFARLEADFDLHEGQATTANLHFDGDAEILMRGRTGLVARDYDQQVWVLRGEERLPAAVRRFGASPRVAAAWLSLRDLFSGGPGADRSRAVLRLQGSWDDPIVVAAN